MGYLEGLRDPFKFAEAAINASRKNCPLIILKSGRSEVGASAAAAHTGSAASGDNVIQALFDQTGIIRPKDDAELFTCIEAFNKAPLPKGREIAIFSNGGGAGTITADSAEKDYGLIIKPFNEEVKKQIKSVNPGIIAGVGNPVDTGASISPEDYIKP